MAGVGEARAKCAAAWPRSAAICAAPPSVLVAYLPAPHATAAPPGKPPTENRPSASGKIAGHDEAFLVVHTDHVVQNVEVHPWTGKSLRQCPSTLYAKGSRDTCLVFTKS